MIPHARTLVSLLALAAAASASSCSGPGNTGRTAISDELAAQVPWVNGRPPALSPAGTPLIPERPEFPPIGRGLEDPGHRGRYECEKLARLEFSTSFFYQTFEPERDGDVGAAEAWAFYDDKSEGSFSTPGGINWYEGSLPTSVPWGMPASRVTGAPRCDDAPNEWAFHFRGGRYGRFGAGLEHPFSIIERPCDPDWGVCPPADPTEAAEAIGIPPRAADGTAYDQDHLYWDISAWDGISFWARRGPEGQGSMIVLVFDKHTSDAMNRQNNAFCTRIKACRTRCINGERCSLFEENATLRSDGTTGPLYRCYDPDLVNPADVAALPEARLELMYPPCGPSACHSAADYMDDDFDGKDCRPFTFMQHESSEFCFDEDDPEPPDSGERCGDAYAKTVTLSTEWKFFKVPFSELRQQGFGKIAPTLDLKSAVSMSLVFTQGWVDTYVDNISFYREVD